MGDLNSFLIYTAGALNQGDPGSLSFPKGSYTGNANTNPDREGEGSGLRGDKQNSFKIQGNVGGCSQDSSVSGDVQWCRTACVVKHAVSRDSPVRTWQSCPGPWASVEGLGAEDHLRLTRCSLTLSGPWELLRGWMSTCSCPSWMRPTCPERGRRDMNHPRSRTATTPTTRGQPGRLAMAWASRLGFCFTGCSDSLNPRRSLCGP